MAYKAFNDFAVFAADTAFIVVLYYWFLEDCIIVNECFSCFLLQKS